MLYLLHYLGAAIHYLVMAIMWTITILVMCPILIVAEVVRLIITKYGDFSDCILAVTENLIVAKPVAFTFNGAVKEWRSRLEEYRANPNYEARQIAKRYLDNSKEGSPCHKNARAYLFAFDKSQEDLEKELNEPCDFDFDEDKDAIHDILLEDEYIDEFDLGGEG